MHSRAVEECDVLTVLVALLILTLLMGLLSPAPSTSGYVASGAFGLTAVALAILVVLGRL
jgi:hypothetical protein